MPGGARHRRHRNRPQRGVTLLELLAVLFIIGVLVAIAYPGYRDYLYRVHRTEARSAVLKYATEQEKFYLLNNTYATSISQLRGAGGDAYTLESGRYVLSILTADDTGFTIQAQYQLADAEAAKCLTLAVNARGERQSAPLGVDECWYR